MIKSIWTVLLATLLLFTNATSGKAMQAVGQGDDENCPPVYTVQPGDTLRAIAERCGSTVSQLLFDNPLIDNSSRIVVGQRIYLPEIQRAAPAASGTQVSAAENSTGTQAAGQTGDTNRNEADTRQGVPTTGQTDQTGDTYRVKAGDSLARIASQLGTSMEVLLLANPEIRNPNLIYANQELRVPDPSQYQALRAEQERQQAEQQQQVVDSVGLADERWIDVDLANQKVRAYEGHDLVQTYSVSTGTWQYPTVTGQYKIWIKLESDDMRGPGYFLRDVPYVMYFYKGYGLHGTYWHSNFGTPMSHGCVNLRTEDAAWLYGFAEVGTVVNVH